MSLSKGVSCLQAELFLISGSDLEFHLAPHLKAKEFGSFMKWEGC